MAKKLALGEQQYLFTSKADGTSSDRLLISAHGGYWTMPSVLRGKGVGYTTVPNWTTLHFLAPHKHVLADPSLLQAILGDAKICDSKAAGDTVHNYSLSKYQGEKHGSADETYESIQDNLEKWGQDADTDVLTIRCRTGRFSPNLASVLSVLESNKRLYADVICSFCRSSMTPLVASPVHDATSKTVGGTRIREFVF